jgi:transcriptional regulator with XRE-family HTH domain
VNLRGLRIARDLTQHEVARRVGLTPAHISHFELGSRVPAPELVEVFARIYGVSVEAYLAALRATPRKKRSVLTFSPKPCGPCGRVIQHDLRMKRRGRPFLSPPDYCLACARPLSDEAIRKQPIEGFVAMIRTLAREPALVRKTVMSDIEE